MMVAGRFVLYWSVPASALLVGCALPSGPDGGGDIPGTLSPQVQQAVDEVTARTQATFEALAGFVDGLDERIEAGDGDLSFGQCPVVDAQWQDGVISIMLDYGQGCANPYYDDAVVAGRITLTLGVLDRSLSIEYEDFAVDERSVTGSISVRMERADLARRLIGDIDIMTSDAGSTQGTLDVELRLATATITINEADLTLTDESESFNAAIENIVIKPVDNGNFVPQAGTISFEIANDDVPPETLSIEIAFDADSPVDGTVQVTVGSGPPVEYQLPGF